MSSADDWKDETVIRATYRSQDLLPAFLDLLRELDPVSYSAWVTSTWSIPPAYVADEGDESAWWESEDCSNCIETLFDQLNACAPEGYYFGAHPGDGSDFGFWKQEEDL